MLLAALATLVLAGSACSDGGSGDVAIDESQTSAPAPVRPPAPIPAGLVRTRDLATVMDTGSPELCLGPIAESYPPQCGGPPLIGWEWAEHKNTYEEQGDVRWGTYSVTGTWDGAAFTATDAVSGALHDPVVPSESATPPAVKPLTDHQLGAIAEDLRDLLPGYLGAYGGEGTDGHVLADVLYDDGALQQWADETYGPNVVIVSAALVDVG